MPTIDAMTSCFTMMRKLLQKNLNVSLTTMLVFLIGCALAQAARAEVVYEQQSAIGRELKIPVHAWSDPAHAPRAVIVALHGLIFSAQAYDGTARHLAEQGYLVLAEDYRGFGDWRDSSKFDSDGAIHFTQSKDDLTNLLKALREKYPNLPVFCMGESFGANYAIWEASTDPDLMDGVILCSISYKVCVHPRLLWVPTFFKGLAHPKQPLNLVPYVKPILDNDKKIVQEALDNPYSFATLSPTDLIKAGITNRRAVQHINEIPETMPILIIAGEKDEIQKTKTLPDMVAKIGSKKTELVVLPGRGHLLLERNSLDPEVASLIDQWFHKESASFIANAGAKNRGREQPQFTSNSSSSSLKTAP